MRLSKKYNVTLSDVIKYALRPKQEIRKKENSKAMIAGAAFTGFLTGFTAAVLLAPESGSELRQDISKMLQETNEKLAHVASDVLHKVENNIKSA